MSFCLLLDENLSPALETTFWSYGIDTVHVRNRGMLSAPDHEVWRYALENERAVVTINSEDFKRLAARTSDHYGVLAIPSGRGRQSQHDNIMAAIDFVGRVNYPSISPFMNRYVEVGLTGRVVSIDLNYTTI